MAFGFTKTIGVTVTDSGILSWDGNNVNGPDWIVAAEDKVILDVTWPIGATAYGKVIEGYVRSSQVKHRASIVDSDATLFSIPDTWLEEGGLDFQLIMTSGALEFKTNVLRLNVGPSINYVDVPAPDPESSWIDLMTSHEAAADPHPQYLIALAELEERVYALEHVGE